MDRGESSNEPGQAKHSSELRLMGRDVVARVTSAVGS